MAHLKFIKMPFRALCNDVWGKTLVRVRALCLSCRWNGVYERAEITSRGTLHTLFSEFFGRHVMDRGQTTICTKARHR
jgi:hypothetical protein